MKSSLRWLPIAVLATIVLAFVLLRPSEDPIEAHERSAESLEVATGRSGAGAGPAAPRVRDEGAPLIDEADREIFAATMTRARRERLDTLSIGPRTVALGRWFLGAPYTPATLEGDPEHLVVNLREFDCVTFVESILALARTVDAAEPTFDHFLTELRDIRYRDGRIDGYPSRLHYFSEWISDNARMGIVQDVTSAMGGVRTDEPIDFMSTNRDRYEALKEETHFATIVAIEEELSAAPRFYIPASRIAEVAPRIRDGDVIAITSALEGLDVAHTGFAVWVEGQLHLMNAPLVGESVNISELPLAQRVARISSQDGIMVARPLD